MIATARRDSGAAGPAVRELRVSPAVLQNLARDQPQHYPALLDSAVGGALGQYSLLAAYPEAALATRADGTLYTQNFTASLDGFLPNLEHWWRTERVDQQLSFQPFCGGWILFLAYELAGEIEPTLRLPQSRLPWQAFAVRVRGGLVHEVATDRVLAFAEAGHESLLEKICADVAVTKDVEPRESAARAFAVGVHEEPDSVFLDRVRQTRERIAAGELYQANLSRWWRAELSNQGAAAHLYASLRKANPAPFAGLLQWGGVCVLSSSPERLVRSSGGKVHTRPIAGTRPRSGIAEAERLEIDALVANPKERAEHIMLVDLERNDLGRVCERGSVHVEELMTIESYPHVHHIVSKVAGQLRADVTPVDVIRATFPGGTITGCPKHRCMQLIAELEAVGRGAYTGSMGYLNLNGDLDLNILIRTMTITGNAVEFRAGAGIVADSDPQRELEETRAKAQGMLASLREAG